MRIGIIGSGNIGGTATAPLARAGHEVVVAKRRGPHSLAELVAAIGPRAHAATVEEAAVADAVVQHDLVRARAQRGRSGRRSRAVGGSDRR